MHGGWKKKIPQTKPPWVEERKNKRQLEFTTLVSPGIGRDEKGALVNAPFIHIGALVDFGHFDAFPPHDLPKISTFFPYSFPLVSS